MARILLIDDDASVRGSALRLLERLGHEVRVAEHGDAGLRLWRKWGADLVITDLHMPGRNGLDVIIELRSFAPDLPLIAISGGPESTLLDLLGTARQAGAVTTLPKPFTVDELLLALCQVLDQTSPQPRPLAVPASEPSSSS